MNHVPPGFVALKYSIDVIQDSYQAALKIHEAAGQRLATLLVLAAWIIDLHSRMVPCDPELTLEVVRKAIAELRTKVPVVPLPGVPKGQGR